MKYATAIAAIAIVCNDISERLRRRGEDGRYRRENLIAAKVACDAPGFYTKHLWFKHQVSAGVITSVARDLSDHGSTSRYLVVEYEPVANHAAEEGSHHYWYNLANRTHLIGCNVVAEEAVVCSSGFVSDTAVFSSAPDG